MTLYAHAPVAGSVAVRRTKNCLFVCSKRSNCMSELNQRQWNIFRYNYNLAQLQSVFIVSSLPPRGAPTYTQKYCRELLLSKLFQMPKNIIDSTIHISLLIQTSQLCWKS